jgi:hypothetical protein
MSSRLDKHVPPDKRFIAHFNTLSYRHPPHSVWSDFLECAALSIRQSVDHCEFREKRYLETINKYDEKERALFPQLLWAVADGLETEGFCDFLGKMFHQIDLGNKLMGQFFTPYHLSLLLAEMCVGELWESTLSPVTIGEPACGAGGMCIAVCEVALKKDINFQQRFCFSATDLDIRCFHMAYIQLSLIGASAMVHHGDTLRWKFNDHWPTPMYVMSGHIWKDPFGIRPQPEQKALSEAMELLSECPEEELPKGPDTITLPNTRELQTAEQLDLFGQTL